MECGPRSLVVMVIYLGVMSVRVQGQVSAVIDGNGNVLPFSSSVDYCGIKDRVFFSRDDCQLQNVICLGTGGRGKGLDKPVCHVVIHDTHLPSPPACDPADCCNVVRAIHQNYIDMGKCDLPFHFMVDNAGNIYHGRGYNRIGAHVSDADLRCSSYGIAFLEEPPSNAAKAAFFTLVYCGKQLACVNYKYTLCGHSSIPSITDSTCPGAAFTDVVSTWPGYDCANFGEEICCKCEDINQVCGTTRNVATITTCTEPGAPAGKIMLNGGPAPKANDNQFPFVAYVNGVCTGTIIHCQYILTAAHCVENDENVSVWIGSTENKGGEKHSAKVIAHEDYNGGGNDIALLKLKKPIPEWTDAIRPICLSSRSGESYAGSTVTVAGWGFIEPDPKVFPVCLRHTGLPVLTDAAALVCTTLAADQFAAGACDKTQATFTGVTDGDSGGPMFLEEGGKLKLIGVIEAMDYDGISRATDVFHHVTNWAPLKAVADEIAACPQN